MRRSALAMALMNALSLLIGPSEGWAEESGCELVVVEASPALDPVWQIATDELRGALTHELEGPECVPLRLWIEPSPPDVLVRVRSADGRETSRPVTDPRALIPVVLGILTTAPSETLPRVGPTGGSAPAAPAQATTRPIQTPRIGADARSSSTLSQETPPQPRSTSLLLGVSTGVRGGVPTDFIVWDTEVRLDILLHDWIILGNIRYAFLGQVRGIPVDSDVYEEIALGFGAGREFRWGGNSIDLTASPSVVFVDMEKDSPVEISGERAQLRIGAALRYGRALGAGWRFTVALDSELAPSSLIHDRHVDPRLPPIPAWTAGLRFGVVASPQ